MGGWGRQKWDALQEKLISLHSNNKGSDQPVQSAQRLCF